MKKILLILLVLFIFMGFPAIAYANSAPPGLDDHDLLIDDIENIDSLVIYGFDADGNRDIIDDYQYGLDHSFIEETKISTERIIDVHNSDKQYADFQLEIKFNDGTVVQSNTTEFIEWSNYKYSVKDNDLQPSGAFSSRKPNSFTVVVFALSLILPWGFTILFEIFTALIFKIKPLKYVCIINAFTNPIMNIILIFACVNIVISYFWLLLILELIVVGVEYWYYLGKFDGVSNWRLLLFTITANAVSWGAYALFNGLW